MLQIDKIWIEDPNGFKIKEWISQSTNHGNATLIIVDMNAKQSHSHGHKNMDGL